MGEGHGEAHLGFTVSGGATPLEQEARETAGCRTGEGETAGVEEDGLVFLGERLGGVHADFTVLLHEGEEIFARHSFDASGLEGLSGDFVA